MLPPSEPVERHRHDAVGQLTGSSAARPVPLHHRVDHSVEQPGDDRRVDVGPQVALVPGLGDQVRVTLISDIRRAIELLPREYRLLEYLMRHAERVVTRTMLFEEVWGYHYDPQTNVIDVHIGRLRRKLEEGGQSQLIHTVRGSGYVLRRSE